jgi:hypothetical protein
MDVMEATEAALAPTTDCAYCRRPIRWLYDAKTHGMVAFDGDPNEHGTHVIHAVSGKALEIPFYEHEYWENQPIARWVVHRRSCGLGPGPMPIVSTLERMARGDNRRSRQPVRPAPSNPGPALAPNGTCDSCGAPIAWVTTQDDQRIPVDLEPHRAGLVTVSSRSGARYTGHVEGFGPTATGLPRYRYHHLACSAPPSPRSVRRAAGIPT